MTKLCPAAMQLVKQVFELSHNAKPVGGDPDGYDRFRSVEYDARTSKWLVPVLEVVNDERIDHIDYEGKGRAKIWFVGDTRADHRTEFPLREAAEALNAKD